LLPSITEKYKFSVPELPINMGWIKTLLGYPEGNLPEPIPGLIRSILDTAPSHTNIQGGYIIMDQFEILDERIIRLDGLEFHPTKAIAHQVKSSEKLAFFMMTAGEGITTWSQAELTQGDPMAGYIIDLIGSEIVVAALDMLQENLAGRMKSAGFNITNRYSPGDCGWPVTDQQKLFSLFPKNFCGITLSETSLMHPIKSVSGIIGIGRDVRKTVYACDLCEMETCLYRYRRETRSVP
jgi:hypothetical protein